MIEDRDRVLLDEFGQSDGSDRCICENVGTFVEFLVENDTGFTGWRECDIGGVSKEVGVSEFIGGLLERFGDGIFRVVIGDENTVEGEQDIRCAISASNVKESSMLTLYQRS